MIRLLVLAVGFAIAGGAVERGNYDAFHYAATLTIDLPGQLVRGDVVVSVRGVGGPSTQIELDAGPALKVIGVWENGRAVAFDRELKLLRIRPEVALAAGVLRRFRIRYEAGADSGLRFFPDQVYTAYFTNHWLPCNDQPDAPGTLSLRVKAPPGWKGISSRRLTRPTVPFVFGFAVGRFDESAERVGKTRLRYLSCGKDGKDVERTFKPSPAILRFLEDKTGTPYPGNAYGQVLVRGKEQQEAAGFALLSEPGTWLLAHEMAHQWFAVGIHCDGWTHFWLNEGMAAFLAAAFAEQYEGRAAYVAHMERAHAIYEKAVAEGKDLPLAAPGLKTRAISYNKGAWVLHLLREELGDRAFWDGLRLYTRARMGHAAVSHDLQVAMEQASGKDLDAFFHRWVYVP